MTEVPTLGEMRRALEDPAPPTLGEMAHANLLYQTDPDAYLEHYGIKGMKWGIRRSRETLARLGGGKQSTETKDEEGNVVGGIRAKTRAGAQKLKDMREGSTLILEDANGASKVLAKQKDGTFKEVYLSADAERVLRTTKKDQSEMSDKEINDAINRSKKIEEYNKLFNPQPNPNADLEAKVAAMELQIKLRNAERLLNPPKKKLVSRFIETVEGGFGAYNRMDKAMNGKLDPMVKQMMADVWAQQSSKRSNPVGDAFSARNQRRRDQQAAEDRFWSGGDDLRAPGSSGSTRVGDMRTSASQQRRVDDFVYNITTMPDPNNPFYNPSPPITPLGPAPTYPELERRG
jgi:hypothetical protein